MLTEDLNDRELARYDRQIRAFGEEGQEKLKDSKVAIVGLGGLGCPASLFLATAGIGDLLLIDYEGIELSNLNRQILHWEEDVGEKNKTESALSKLKRLNSDIDIEVFDEKMTEENLDILDGVDVIVDALDNFETRYLLNEFAVEKEIPFVHAAVEGFHGQMTTIIPGKTPCLRCMFPEGPEKEEIFPIIGTTSGLFGIMLANEVIKILTGNGELLKGKLFIFDIAYNNFETVKIDKDPNCSICGYRRS
ncbi:MAG: HesA/MoeB/ThiF family protein [Candidatus Natronoplasma sp.]